MGLLKKIFGGRPSDAAIAARVSQLRNFGALETVATVYGHLRDGITPDDYLLMGCDNSCAGEHYQELSAEERSVFSWFTTKDFPSSAAPNIGNYHGTIKDGVNYYEAIYTNLPKPQYQASAAEVAWHYRRVKELRAAGVEQAERVRTMRQERTARPWATA